MPTSAISREAITGHLFSGAVEAVNRALRKAHPGSGVDPVILDGHFEPALLMLWVAAREQVYERHLTIRREALVADFLTRRFGALPPASLTPTQLLEVLQDFGTQVYAHLEELWEETALVREGIFTLVLHHPLGMLLSGQESEPGHSIALQLAPHPRFPQLFELTVLVGGEPAVEIQVHGHAGDRRGVLGVKPTASGRAVWRVFLIPPHEKEFESLAQFYANADPSPVAYSWGHVAEAMRKRGTEVPVKPLGQLPNDLIALVKGRKGA